MPKTKWGDDLRSLALGMTSSGLGSKLKDASDLECFTIMDRVVDVSLQFDFSGIAGSKSIGVYYGEPKVWVKEWSRLCQLIFATEGSSSLAMSAEESTAHMVQASIDFVASASGDATSRLSLDGSCNINLQSLVSMKFFLDSGGFDDKSTHHKFFKSALTQCPGETLTDASSLVASLRNLFWTNCGGDGAQPGSKETGTETGTHFDEWMTVCQWAVQRKHDEWPERLKMVVSEPKQLRSILSSRARYTTVWL